MNDAALAWLSADTEFKVDDPAVPLRTTLARELRALEVHLVMWRAKYGAWIPDDPSHALVYLGDEEAHGAPFPSGIENTIAQVISLRRLGGG